MTLKMLEGFVDKGKMELRHDGGPAIRTRMLFNGEVEAATIMEPFISLAEKRGCRVIGESKYWGLLYVNNEDAEKARLGIFRALRKSVDAINANLAEHASFLLRDIPSDLLGDFKPSDLNLSRLDYVYPEDYTEEEFNRARNWMAGYGLKPDSGASYQDLVKL